MPRLHPREKITQAADLELWEAVEAIARKHKLTHIEKVQMAHRMADRFVSTYLKFELRYERHGDADTPAGLAGEEDDGA